MKRRVLIFSYAYYPHESGAEIAIRKITTLSPDATFDLITRKFSQDELSLSRVENVSVYRIRVFSRYLFPFAAFFKALSLHRKHAHNVTWAVMASYGAFAALFFKWVKPRVPFVLTLQEGDSIEHIRRRLGFLFPLYTQIFKRADIVTAISKYLATFAKERGFKKTPYVIPNGVETERIVTDVSWPKHKRQEIKLISTSRLVEKNGIDTVLRALSKLPNSIHLVLVGDGELMDDLKHLSSKLSVSDRVEFAGALSHDAVFGCLDDADIFVRPARSEGLGSSYLEAMARGLPVIATPVGGITDFIEDQKTGFFCEVNNPESLSRVVQFICDPQKREHVRRIVENARILVAASYTWEHIAKNMRKLLITGAS